MCYLDEDMWKMIWNNYTATWQLRGEIRETTEECEFQDVKPPFYS